MPGHRDLKTNREGGTFLELAELTSYAKEAYGIEEDHKWASFPGFSVLADPASGKWVALLMRQWDTQTGTEIQRCDIKCGPREGTEKHLSFLLPPFRMKGSNWTGVAFDGRTDPEVVFRLFDRAMESEARKNDSGRRGATLIVKPGPVPPPAGGSARTYTDTPLPFGRMQTPPFSAPSPVPDVPERIGKMLALYRYGDNSLADRSENFHRQGVFMADYVDNAPWPPVFRRRFPTYHDLNVKQLRGYFSWRTLAREGNWQPAPATLAYLYLYELLSGIGVTSPRDALEKMEAFEEGFLDSGVGDPGMRSNLHRWMFEFAIVHGLPAETVHRCAPVDMLEDDARIAALAKPEAHADDDVLTALAALSGRDVTSSPVAKADRKRAGALFATAWRLAAGPKSQGGAGLSEQCFGAPRWYRWYPLSNAIHWEEHAPDSSECVLDACRRYRCVDGIWQEQRYERLYFDRKLLSGFLHEMDRVFRRRLKTGHYLRAKTTESWATPFAEAALAAEKQAVAEKRRQGIRIDLSGLDRIREDAAITRDSLIVDEVDEADEPQIAAEVETGFAAGSAPDSAQAAPEALAGIDSTLEQVLAALLDGEPVEPFLSQHHLMPSLVADSLNEALFDEVGDNVLECDGKNIELVEEYREDLEDLVKGGC